MLRIDKYLLEKKSLPEFLVWFITEHSHPQKENILHCAISVGGAWMNDDEEKKEEVRISKIIENAYFVTGVKILSANMDPDPSFNVKLFQHAGYPGGQTDKEMGECWIEFDKITFILLVSEYFSLINSGKYKPQEFSDDE
mgnify:CR=1 FL=1